MSIDRLRPLLDGAGCFVDFDGTLSEIAPTPEAAVPVPGAAEALEALARKAALVAVVSGRPADEVRARLGSPAGVRWFGLYGLEERPAGPAPADRGPGAATGFLPAVEGAVAGLDGVRVEPKGATVAVHYRQAPDTAAARAELAGRLLPVAERFGLRLLEGKRVVELGPAEAPTKGDVIRRHGAGLRAVCVAGDDLADLHAFEAVDELAAAGAVGVKVAVRTAETPRELVEAADEVVDGPAELVALLRDLAG